MFSENTQPVPLVVNMAESHQHNVVQNRFSMANPVVQTQRVVMFDASHLQIGSLEDITDDDSSDPTNFVQELTRNLFPDDTATKAVSNSVSTHVNEVTLDSVFNNIVGVPTATTTIADNAMQLTTAEEDYSNILADMAASLGGAYAPTKVDLQRKAFLKNGTRRV